MDFHTYTTMRDWARRTTPEDRLSNDIDAFYGKALHDAYQMRSGQFMGQMLNERDWERHGDPTTMSGPPSCRCSHG